MKYPLNRLFWSNPPRLYNKNVIQVQIEDLVPADWNKMRKLSLNDTVPDPSREGRGHTKSYRI